MPHGEPYSFLLESVEQGEKIGRYTFLGARPSMRLIAGAKGVVLERGKKRERMEGDPVSAIRKLLQQHRRRRCPICRHSPPAPWDISLRHGAPAGKAAQTGEG